MIKLPRTKKCPKCGGRVTLLHDKETGNRYGHLYSLDEVERGHITKMCYYDERVGRS